jgi:hypothetical protein
VDAGGADVRDEVAQILDLLVAAWQAQRNLRLVVDVVLGDAVDLQTVLRTALLEANVPRNIVQ